jgi:hypothetical protein
MRNPDLGYFRKYKHCKYYYKNQFNKNLKNFPRNKEFFGTFWQDPEDNVAMNSPYFWYKFLELSHTIFKNKKIPVSDWFDVTNKNMEELKLIKDYPDKKPDIYTGTNVMRSLYKYIIYKYKSLDEFMKVEAFGDCPIFYDQAEGIGVRTLIDDNNKITEFVKFEGRFIDIGDYFVCNMCGRLNIISQMELNDRRDQYINKMMGNLNEDYYKKIDLDNLMEMDPEDMPEGLGFESETIENND